MAPSVMRVGQKWINNYNNLKLVLSFMYVCRFSFSIQIIFVFFLETVKKETLKTCKISYNCIFITKMFLKMDKKRYT